MTFGCSREEITAMYNTIKRIRKSENVYRGRSKGSEETTASSGKFFADPQCFSKTGPSNTIKLLHTVHLSCFKGNPIAFS